MTIAEFQPLHALAVLPEALLIVLGAVVLLLDLALPKDQKRNLAIATAIGMLIALIVAVLFSRPAGEPELLFGGMIRHDMLGFVFRVLVIFTGMLVALFTMDSPGIGRRVEFYALLIGSTVAMSFLAASSDLIMLYLALETTSIVGYVMAGFLKRDDLSVEAGVKYFVYGALTSAIMLYGFSLLYGFSGTTNLYGIVDAVATGVVPPLVSLIVAVMIVVGVGFKVSIVPFHFWVPDVYTGAPTAVTAFISTASKSAGFAILFRIFLAALGANPDWMPMMVAMAAVTMTVGNLLAIAQTNIKRLLAYSSIAHAGYAMMGFVALTETGLAAAVFYLGAYVVTNLVAFGPIIIYGAHEGTDDIAAYSGMSRRNPTLALVMLVGFLSLAGMPPFAGFFAKFFVIAAAIEAGLVWLAVVAIINSIIGLYYYLVVLKVVFVGKPAEDSQPFGIPAAAGLALGLLSIGTILVGTLAAPWFDLALEAAASIF